MQRLGRLSENDSVSDHDMDVGTYVANAESNNARKRSVNYRVAFL